MYTEMGHDDSQRIDCDKGGKTDMRFNLRTELKTFISYFLIAFAAEMVGFVGWINEKERGGDVFQLSAAFNAHEVSRLPMWLLTFLALSLIRLLFRLIMHRVELKGAKQS
jgi:hypothetical protein